MLFLEKILWTYRFILKGGVVPTALILKAILTNSLETGMPTLSLPVLQLPHLEKGDSGFPTKFFVKNNMAEVTVLHKGGHAVMQHLSQPRATSWLWRVGSPLSPAAR